MTEMLKRQELKDRGWTDTLINRFLPTPDATKPNPRYRSAAPMKLYSSGRVASIEAGPLFRKAKEKSEQRKKAAEIATATKQARMQEYVNELVVDLPRIERDDLILLARSAPFVVANPAAAQVPVEQLCVNYLRHCKTEYEAQLDAIRGMTGSREAYFELKGKILQAIAAEYDWLAGECNRQLQNLLQTMAEIM